MKTKTYLFISIISFLFYQCIEEEEAPQLRSDGLSVVEQKRESDILSDSIVTADSIQEEADPPKDKDPYIKRTEEGGE
ncbi:hypothetical protein [Empedobacter sp. UBA7620]|uniref:hypothetical protein n=1 Tax=Empedobacter sp. UBA7620 TaxID=1946452 RepID=UPI0025C190CF|nr:hypothetical protein [Empedobacter sp. UBA7620]